MTNGHTPSVPPSIPGRKIDEQSVGQLREVVADLLERNTTRFPGAQPVSFARQHLSEIQRSDYFVCEKTDGIRVLLFLYYTPDVEPVTFFIDRKNDFYEVTPPLRIPYHALPDDDDKFLYNTILDGELVHDQHEGEPHPRLIYYTFDCLVLDGSPKLWLRPYEKRLAYMNSKVIQVKKAAEKTAAAQGRPRPPFEIKEKQNYNTYRVKMVLKEVLPKLPHGNDGLIFACKNTPYVFGTDDHILKWKPAHENTIDFKLRIGKFPEVVPPDGSEPYTDWDAKPDRFELLVQYDRRDYRPWDNLVVSDREWEDLKGLDERLDGRIIECYREDVSGQWKYKKDGTAPRWRDDKQDANHITTVNKVLASIRDPVTEMDLMASQEETLRKRERDLAKQGQVSAPPAGWQSAEHADKKRKFSEVNGH